MKNRGKSASLLIAGVLVGLAVGPTAHAVSEALTATRSIQPIYVDGRQVEMEAYAINGSNYVKLRDIGQAVGFNVYWQDGVQIDTGAPYTGEAPASAVPTQAPAPTPTPTETPAPVTTGQSYTISTDHWSREDFSQQANPAVFTGVYSRDLYNAMRQTLVDEGTGSTGPVAYCMVSKDNYSAVKNLMGRLDGVLRYEHYVPANLANYYDWLDYFSLSAAMPDSYQVAYDFIQPTIAEANRLKTDRARVEYLNNYLCTLLAYKKNTTAAIADIFSSHSGELQAACGIYARAFKFLCQAADIPCITITTASHGWNLVYVDGQWLHVDVSTNDVNNRHIILLASTVTNRADTAPEATAFLKELLVPGSTK